jgi:tetratricopeptide (TPR) repeat protein
LDASAERNAIRRQHAEFFLAVAEREEDDVAARLHQLELEHNNLRAALAWCREDATGGPTGLRMAGALGRFWDIRGHWAEGRGWLAGALAHPAAQACTLARGWALARAGGLAAWPYADFEAARLLWEESLAIAEELGDQNLRSYSLVELGQMARERGDRETARVLFEKSLAVAREGGNKGQIAAALSLLAGLARGQGDTGTARVLLDESLALVRETGNKYMTRVFMGRIFLALSEGR